MDEFKAFQLDVLQDRLQGTIWQDSAPPRRVIVVAENEDDARCLVQEEVNAAYTPVPGSHSNDYNFWGNKEFVSCVDITDSSPAIDKNCRRIVSSEG